MGSFAAFAIVAAGVLATAASDAARTHPNPAITSAAPIATHRVYALAGSAAIVPSRVALYESPRFTCKVDTSISGTADVRLSNGKTEDTGFSASKCDSECTSKSACQSFVWKESDGYCELWSKTGPTFVHFAHQICLKTSTPDGGTCSSASECSSGTCRGKNCCGNKGQSTGCIDCDNKGECAKCSSDYLLHGQTLNSCSAYESSSVHSNRDCNGFGKPCTIVLHDGFADQVSYTLDEPLDCSAGVLQAECVVVVSISNAHSEWVTVNPSQLRWSVNDWHQTKTIRIETVHDYVHASNEVRQVHLLAQVTGLPHNYRGHDALDLYIRYTPTTKPTTTTTTTKSTLTTAHERDICSFDKACGLTAGADGEEVDSNCCKTCQIQGINYKIDVNTFIDTMSRGSRKNPMMGYEYCGLEQFQSWPSEKDQTVGVLNAPFTEDQADALPFREPDGDHYTRTDLPLQRYDERGAAEVLFVKHSYKMMHSSSYKALRSLATRWNKEAGAYGFKLLVTQGYEPLPADRPQSDLHKDLYYEARELHMTIVYTEFNHNGQLKSQCGSKCLIGRQDERDNITSPFHEYAVRLKTKDEVPACLMDGASRADWVTCLAAKSLQNQEYNYRLLADMAFTQFDYVEHKVLPGTESTQPIDSVVVAMRDHHRACGASADITFLLDGSGSVGHDGWRDQLKFVRDFTGAVRPSEDGAHIAVATFAGPRFSHFADDIDYEHCPLGTSNIGDMRGLQSTNNVCACAEGASCSGPKGTTANEVGCYDDIAIQYLSVNECSDALAEAGIFGFNSYEYSKKQSIYPECIAKRANVYTPDCSSCSCSEPDYTWDESHSSWTNFNFKDHATAEEIFKTLDEGTPTAENLVCPVIGHGKVHTEIRYEEFHAKDDFCWADGARHLAMGLKHVLIGNGEQNDNGGGGDFGMFDPRNGARASQKFPRILIVLTDGKSNPHFEPDQWMTEIFKAGIEVFAVGMGDRPANGLTDFERRGYKKELNVMASEPLDYHRFDVQGASNLNEILLHLTDGLCAKPVFMPPGGLKLDPQLDEGQSQNYQISCDHMTENVFVMVDTSKGHSRVFVSVDVREPSEFNKGTDGAEDISANRHKIIKFEGGASLAEKKNIFIGVTNTDAATAEFRIQVFLDVFQDNGVELKGVMVDKKKAGDVIYAPKFKTGNSVYGSLDDWEISVANSGSSTLNNKGFFEYKSGKGIVVTAKGAAEFASVSYVVGTLELTAAHKKLGTANRIAGGSAAKTRAACSKLCDDTKGGAVQCTHYEFDESTKTCVLSDPGCLNAFFSIDFTHKFTTSTTGTATTATRLLRVHSNRDCDGFGKPCTIKLHDGLVEEVHYTLEEPIICPPGIADKTECVVVVNISNSHPEWVAVNPCRLRWTADDWHQTKTVRIETVHDYVHSSVESRQVHLMTQVTGSYSKLYRGYDPMDLYIESAPTGSAQCRATGDPHYTTFDGKYWHYYDGNRRNPTRVTYYKSTKRDFVVQAQVRGNPAVACAIAGREGNDRVMINNCGGGVRVEADFHTKNVDHQPRIDVSGDTYTIYFKSGAWVRAQVTGWGLNIYAESVDPGSTCGMCGNFNGNSGDDTNGYRVNAYESLKECQMVSSRAYPTSRPCKNGPNSGDGPSCDIWEYTFEGEEQGDTVYVPSMKYCPYEPTFVKPLIGAQDVEDITDFVKRHTEEEQKRGVFVFDIENGNFEVADKYDTVESKKACTATLDGSKMVTECKVMEGQGGVDFTEMYTEVLEDCTADYSVLGGPKEVSGIEDGEEELRDSLQTLEYTCIELFIRYGHRNCEKASCIALKNVLCPNECSGNGKCNDAACQCNAGFAGKACDIDTSVPPTVTDMDKKVCDTQSDKDPGCPHELVITGAGFYCEKGCNAGGNDLGPQCRFEVTDDSSTYKTWVTDAIFIGEHAIMCPVPSGKDHTETKLGMYEGSQPLTTSVSVRSAKANAWSTKTFDFTFFDSTCQQCDKDAKCIPNPGTCQVDGVCYKPGETNPTGAPNPCMKCDPKASNTDFTFTTKEDVCQPIFVEGQVYEHIIYGGAEAGPIVGLVIDASDNVNVNGYVSKAGKTYGELIKYTIPGGMDPLVGSWFTVDESGDTAGQIRLKKEIDMQQLCSNMTHCVADPTKFNGFFQVEACDYDGYCSRTNVIIELVTDTNTLPYFPYAKPAGAGYCATVSELAPTGSPVNVFPCEFPDNTDGLKVDEQFGKIEFSFFGSAFNMGGAFDINTNTGAVTVGDVEGLNYEVIDQVNCLQVFDDKATCDRLKRSCVWDTDHCEMLPTVWTVKGEDSFRGNHTVELKITIINEEEPPTGIRLFSDDATAPVDGELVENAPAGTVIGELRCLDPETGRDPTTDCTYKVAGGQDFEIVTNEMTGLKYLAAKKQYDFETLNDKTQTAMVIATDKGGKASKPIAIPVTIIDANEKPINVKLTITSQLVKMNGDTLTVGEEMRVGTIIGEISAEDPDAGFEDNPICQLLSGVKQFEVNQNKLSLLTPLDFETNPTVKISIACIDRPLAGQLSLVSDSKEYTFEITTFSCKDATYFMCASKDQCVRKKLVCDGGAPDCDDGSDEQGCTTTSSTSTSTTSTFSCKDATYFMCASKDQCVRKKLVCDGGAPDCDDGSDEQGCTTTSTTSTSTTSTFSCKDATYFMCASKDQCVRKKLVCDGGAPDCDDGSDEQGCTSTTPDPFVLRLSSTGPCVVTDNCVTSSQYPSSYQHFESCIIVTNPGNQLTFSAFSTEAGYDTFVIDGLTLSGELNTESSEAEAEAEAGVEPVHTTDSGSMAWSTDDSESRQGWRACFTGGEGDDFEAGSETPVVNLCSDSESLCCNGHCVSTNYIGDNDNDCGDGSDETFPPFQCYGEGVDVNVVATLVGHSSFVWSVSFNHDGSVLASGSDDGTVKLWRMSDNTLIKTLAGHSNWVGSVAFNHDGSVLASGSGDTTVKLWRMSDNTLIKTLEGHSGSVWSVAFNHDGSVLASGSADTTVKLWRMSDNTLIKTLQGHAYWVYSVAFNHDGSVLASGLDDDTIKLWRMSDNTLIKTLQGHAGDVGSVAFNHDGSVLASGSTDNTVKLWRETCTEDCSNHGSCSSLAIYGSSYTCDCDNTNVLGGGAWSGKDCGGCNGVQRTPDPTKDCDGITSAQCEAIPILLSLCPIACDSCVASTTTTSLTTTTTTATATTTTGLCNGAGDPEECGHNALYTSASCSLNNLFGKHVQGYCPVLCDSCTWTTTTSTSTTTTETSFKVLSTATTTTSTLSTSSTTASSATASTTTKVAASTHGTTTLCDGRDDPAECAVYNYPDDCTNQITGPIVRERCPVLCHVCSSVTTEVCNGNPDPAQCANLQQSVCTSNSFAWQTAREDCPVLCQSCITTATATTTTTVSTSVTKTSTTMTTVDRDAMATAATTAAATTTTVAVNFVLYADCSSLDLAAVELATLTAVIESVGNVTKSDILNVTARCGSVHVGVLMKNEVKATLLETAIRSGAVVVSLSDSSVGLFPVLVTTTTRATTTTAAATTTTVAVTTTTTEITPTTASSTTSTKTTATIASSTTVTETTHTASSTTASSTTVTETTTTASSTTASSTTSTKTTATITSTTATSTTGTETTYTVSSTTASSTTSTETTTTITSTTATSTTGTETMHTASSITASSTTVTETTHTASSTTASSTTVTETTITATALTTTTTTRMDRRLDRG